MGKDWEAELMQTSWRNYAFWCTLLTSTGTRHTCDKQTYMGKNIHKIKINEDLIFLNIQTLF